MHSTVCTVIDLFMCVCHILLINYYYYYFIDPIIVGSGLEVGPASFE